MATQVRMRVEIYVRTGPGRWGWKPLGGEYPETTEYPTSETQLLRALMAYSTMAARLVSGAVQRFRLVAVSAAAGALVGLYEWARSVETGRLIPAAEPFVHWSACGAQGMIAA